MFRLSIYTVFVLGIAIVTPQNHDVQDLDDLIKKMFQTTEQPLINPTVNVELPPGVPPQDRCYGGECVVYYQCTNNSINTDGEGIIDIRFSADNPRECHHYLDICCGAENKVKKPINLNPLVQPRPAGCGYRNNNGIGHRISGADSESEYGEFPWVVAIFKTEQRGNELFNVYQCGGSLIHPQVVLTAAHCTQGRKVNTLKIRAGEWDTQTKNELYPHQDRDILDVIVHPEYYRGGLFNDVALLILKTEVSLEKNIQTVCLPPQNAVFDYSRCTAAGWGKDVFGVEGKYQVILKKVELPIVPRATCQNMIRQTGRRGPEFILHESFICAGGEYGKDTCKGDGGSPLVCPIQNIPNQYYQSGIVAWGIGCGENQVPGVYANVALFRNWIDQQFAQLSLDSSYYTVT